VFISSHLLDEVEKTCNAVAIIDRGQLIAQGPIRQVIGDAHSLADRFLGLTSRVGGNW
jgi:ABC-2 type transport system ATP-binding protein